MPTEEFRELLARSSIGEATRKIREADPAGDSEERYDELRKELRRKLRDDEITVDGAADELRRFMLADMAHLIEMHVMSSRQIMKQAARNAETLLAEAVAERETMADSDQDEDED
jgi:hypothetical protein